MGKAKSNFKITDIRRAVSAISGAGLKVYGVTIATDGSINVQTADNSNQPEQRQNSSPFDDWKAAQDQPR